MGNRAENLHSLSLSGEQIASLEKVDLSPEKYRGLLLSIAESVPSKSNQAPRNEQEVREMAESRLSENEFRTMKRLGLSVDQWKVFRDVVRQQKEEVKKRDANNLATEVVTAEAKKAKERKKALLEQEQQQAIDDNKELIGSYQ